MTTIQLEIEDQIFDQIRQLADARGCSWQDLVKNLLRQAAPHPATEDVFLGLFGDEPELIDQVVDAAMQAREEQGRKGHSQSG